MKEKLNELYVILKMFKQLDYANDIQTNYSVKFFSRINSVINKR